MAENEETDISIKSTHKRMEKQEISIKIHIHPRPVIAENGETGNIKLKITHTSHACNGRERRNREYKLKIHTHPTRAMAENGETRNIIKIHTHPTLQLQRK